MTVATGSISTSLDIRFMITTDNQMLKIKMLETCIAKQQSLIEDFKTRIKNLLETSGIGNEEEYDNNELSLKAQSIEEVNSINHELDLANREMIVLESLKALIKETKQLVSPGAVVVTDRETFFISVSIEQFELEGESYFGLSMKSPLYQAMKGKRKGDKFNHKGITYRIEDLF